MTKHQAQHNARRKLQAAARRFAANAHRKANPYLPPAFFMTDRPDRTPEILHVAQNLPSGWGVIYRHFGAPDREKIAASLAAIAGRRGLCLLIAADPDLCRKVSAHGVHWPARQLPALSRRRYRCLETASAHNATERRHAVKAGVDALIVSTVFQSPSPTAGRPMGPQRLLRIAEDSTLPLYALGGMTPDNAGRVAARCNNACIGFAAVSCIHDVWV